jgi:hypothetical protein
MHTAYRVCCTQCILYVAYRKNVWPNSHWNSSKCWLFLSPWRTSIPIHSVNIGELTCRLHPPSSLGCVPWSQCTSAKFQPSCSPPWPCTPQGVDGQLPGQPRPKVGRRRRQKTPRHVGILEVVNRLWAAWVAGLPLFNEKKQKKIIWTTTYPYISLYTSDISTCKLLDLGNSSDARHLAQRRCFPRPFPRQLSDPPVPGIRHGRLGGRTIPRFIFWLCLHLRCLISNLCNFMILNDFNMFNVYNV